MTSLEVGHRSSKILVHENFRYQKNKVTKTKIHWRCWRQDCRAYLQTLLFDLDEEDPDIQIIGVPGEHNHAEDREVIDRIKMKGRMNETIRNDPTKPLKRVFDETLATAGPCLQEDYTPSYPSLKSCLRRTRASVLPDIPEDIESVVVENEWATTWAGRRFLSHQDNDWGILVFATERNIRKLSRCADVYMDGTFKTCPHPYMQFVTIHGNYHGRVLPFIMCLLTGKTIGHYRQLIKHVKRKVRRICGHHWDPDRIVTDFEGGMFAAIETELPTTRLSGCYFHFCQSLWRRVAELGMSRAYHRRQRMRRTIRKIMAIAYLPLPLVRQNFYRLRDSRSVRRLVRRYPELTDFLIYVQVNYIEGNQFPPRTWNVFNRDVDTRTNNYVEGKLTISL